MKILVCGGRKFADWRLLKETLDKYPDDTVLIHGAAPGADDLADRYGKKVRKWKVVPYPADWKKYDDAAGPIRNQRMLDEGKPDRVIAFPGGHGTANMIRKARAAGVPVDEISAREDRLTK